MTRPRPPSDAGFTLVELLASLAVLALVSLMLLGSLGGRSAAWERLDRQTAAEDAVEAAQDALADRIEHIWPVTYYIQRPPGPRFDGRAAEMTFLAPPLDSQGAGPLRRYRLSLDAAGDLTLESMSDVALDARRWDERRVLLHGVQAVDFAYFGSPAPGRAAGWQGEWRERASMPGLVRVRLAFADGDRRRWPDLLVRPQADIDTDCRLVVATGGCVGR